RGVALDGELDLRRELDDAHRRRRRRRRGDAIAPAERRRAGDRGVKQRLVLRRDDRTLRFHPPIVYRPDLPVATNHRVAICVAFRNGPAGLTWVCRRPACGAGVRFGTFAAMPTSPSIVSGRPPIAYFCMEFGLDPAFPIYAGGLGILAGDHMKSVGDLHVPVI